ncbi:MAG: DEAD/DEAH box helicase, partial [Euryarchaeota archaeon]|nr:DEAD/DEAH box helicase [Euryarchaeota archaeon]
HELIGSKRGAQLSAALERLRELAGRDFQRIGISATVAEPEKVARFIHPYASVRVVEVTKPKQMELRVEVPAPKKGDAELAEKLGVSLEAATRVRRIGELIQEHGQVLIFVNTREMAEALAVRCRSAGMEVGIHHSSLSQEVRIATEEDFRRQKLKALICTSSLELGIDIGSVELVVQYGSPRQVSRLLQRAGRSGHRYWQASKCVIIPADSEDALEAIAIAELAGRRELEVIKPWEKPYDVLAHQLAGLALEYGEVSRERALEVLGRSFTFSSLEEEELDEVLSLMQELRLLRVGEQGFRPAKGTRMYYYENLSTIPDEKRYTVVNLVSRQRIGVLDEAFVVRHAEEGARIIFRGTPWRVVAVDREEVKVEPLGEAAGAVPSWVGEDIPVPYAVARRVAELREDEPEEHEAADAYTLKRALAHVRGCRRRGFRVPGRREVLVEMLRDMTVLHTQAGTRVNETLSRAFSALLSARLGQSIRAVSDGYRVVLMCGVSRDVLEELFGLGAEQLRQVLELSLRRTRLPLEVPARRQAVRRGGAGVHLELGYCGACNPRLQGERCGEGGAARDNPRLPGCGGRCQAAGGGALRQAQACGAALHRALAPGTAHPSRRRRGDAAGARGGGNPEGAQEEAAPQEGYALLPVLRLLVRELHR